MATVKKAKIPDLLPPFQRKKAEEKVKTKPDEKWGYNVSMAKGATGDAASKIEITPGSDDKTQYENEKLRGIQDEVKVSKCINTDIAVTQKCNIIKLIKCDNCTLKLNGAISGVDVNNCNNIRINLGKQETDKVEISGSQNIAVDCKDYVDISTVQFINENSYGTKVDVTLGDGKTAELMLPDKFEHRLVVKKEKDSKEVAVVNSKPSTGATAVKPSETIEGQKGTPRKGAQQKKQLTVKDVAGDDVLIKNCEICYIPVTAAKSLVISDSDDIKIRLLGTVTDIRIENSKNVNIDFTDISDLQALTILTSQTAHASVTYKLAKDDDFAHDLELPNQFVHRVNPKDGSVSFEVAQH